MKKQDKFQLTLDEIMEIVQTVIDNSLDTDEAENYVKTYLFDIPREEK